MPRKTANYKVESAGRDHGKLFLITEMPSSQGEAWAARSILALMANNTDIPEDFETLGMAGLAEMGLKALSSLKWHVLEPLLVEMMECVEIIPDPKVRHVHRPLIEDDIEEIKTRLDLRKEWWALHMDFLAAVAPSLPRHTPIATATTEPGRVTRTSQR